MADWRVSDGDWHEPAEWNYRGRQVDEQGVAVNAPRPTPKEAQGSKGALARVIRAAGEGGVRIPVAHMKQMSVRAALEAARAACPLKGRGRGAWIMRSALLKMGYCERDAERAAVIGAGLKGLAKLTAQVRWLVEQGRRRG